MLRRMLPVLVLLAACGDDGGSLSLDNYPEEDVNAECEYLVECGLSPDLTTCKASQELPIVDQFISDAEAGLFEADPALLAKCLERPDSCETQLNLTSEELAVIMACIDAQRGTQALGATCTASSQCASALCIKECQETCCEGVCTEGSLNLGGSGDACRGGDCQVGLYCRVESQTTASCQPQVAASQPCMQVDACIDGHTCVGDGQAPGTCTAMAAPGEACVPTSVNKDLTCADFTTYCDVTSGTCDPRRADGESCDETTPCLFYASCVSGTCRTRPASGKSCIADGPRCLGDLDCIGGTCQFEDFTVEVCTL